MAGEYNVTILVDEIAVVSESCTVWVC